MTPVEIVSGPPDDDVPSEITVLGVPDRMRLPVVAAVSVQPVSNPPPSTSTLPIDAEKDDAEPSVPSMETDGGAVSDSVPAARVTVRLESAHAPPPGAVHAYAGEATNSGVATATAATAADRSLASDMDLSGREQPPCLLIGCATAGLQLWRQSLDRFPSVAETVMTLHEDGLARLDQVLLGLLPMDDLPPAEVYADAEGTPV